MGNEAAPTGGGWIQAVAVGRKPIWTLVRILVLVATVVVLFRYVVLLRKIESTSMLPTFREGTVHLIHRLAYRRTGGPQRGDIVAIRTSGETVMYIKRIVGLPGETLAIRDGTVVINGVDLSEPYVSRVRNPWNRPPRKLGQDEYFVIGDNRALSQEQHEFGAIGADRVVGKVIW